MRYVTNNTFSNFAGAIRSGDKQTTMDMFAYELAELASKHPEQLKEVLKNSQVDSGSSAKSMIKAVISNIENPQLRYDVAKLIYEKRTGQEPKASAGGVDPISAVANAIGEIAGVVRGGQEKKLQQEQAKAALQQKAFEFLQGGKMSTGAIIGLSALVLGFVGFVIYMVKKNKTAA